jgi:hypothetical protein
LFFPGFRLYPLFFAKSSPGFVVGSSIAIQLVRMNSRQQNKLAMYLAVKAVCDANNSVWQKLPAFADGYADFITHLNNIQRPPQSQKVATNGTAPDKAQAQQIMCQATVVVASAIRAHAVKTKNDVVAGAINFSISDLMHSADADLAKRCQSIHDLADTGLDHLAVHGVTAAKLVILKTAIVDFKMIVENPRPVITLVKTAPSQLSDEFGAADKALNEGLDDLIEQFQFSNAKFVSDYQAAREITEPATSQSSRAARSTASL